MESGSVVSRICSRGKPGALPNILLKTSAERLDPPIPSRTTSSMLPLVKGSSEERIRLTFANVSTGACSQPSRLEISSGAGFQTR
ncbi:MAG: hypothetical protein ABFC95_07055 [Smithella sp.]